MEGAGTKQIIMPTVYELRFSTLEIKEVEVARVTEKSVWISFASNKGRAYRQSRLGKYEAYYDTPEEAKKEAVARAKNSIENWKEKITKAEQIIDKYEK